MKIVVTWLSGDHITHFSGCQLYCVRLKHHQSLHSRCDYFLQLLESIGLEGQPSQSLKREGGTKGRGVVWSGSRFKPCLSSLALSFQLIATRNSEMTHQPAGYSVDHNSLREVHGVGHSKNNQSGVPPCWPVKQVIQDCLLPCPQEIQLG